MKNYNKLMKLTIKFLKIGVISFILFCIFGVILYLVLPEVKITSYTLITSIADNLTVEESFTIEGYTENTGELTVDTIFKKVGTKDRKESEKIIVNNNHFSYKQNLEDGEYDIRIYGDLNSPLLSFKFEKVAKSSIAIKKAVKKLKNVDLSTKKKLFYIYYQLESIIKLKTDLRFGSNNINGSDSKKQYIEDITEDIKKQLVNEDKDIDGEMLTIFIQGQGFLEGIEKKWEKPSHDSMDILKYVYTKEELKKKEYEENIKTSFDELKTSDNIWSQCSIKVRGNGFLSRFNNSLIERTSDTTVSIHARFNGENIFGKRVSQPVICKYRLNKYGKYEIYSVDL